MEKTAVTRWLAGRDVLSKNDRVRYRIIFLSLPYTPTVLDRRADIDIAMDVVQSIDKLVFELDRTSNDGHRIELQNTI